MNRAKPDRANPPPQLKLHKSASALPAQARQAIVTSLNQVVCDGIDLVTHVEVAHWNIKGSHFAALHALFDSLAAELTAHNDEMAERATALGGHVFATARHVAQTSRLSEYPQEISRDLEHVAQLAERLQQTAVGLREARAVAMREKDDDTVELLTGVVLAVEERTWMLLAHLEG